MFQPLLSLRWCLNKMCLDVADVEKRKKKKKAVRNPRPKKSSSRRTLHDKTKKQMLAETRLKQYNNMITEQ